MNFYDPEATAELDHQAATEGVMLGTAPHDAAWYQGIPTAGVLGVARLGAKGTSAAYDVLNEVARPFSRGIDAVGGTSLEGWFDSMRFANYRTINALKPDPATTGFVGQVLHGLVDVGGSAALTGPAGAGYLEGMAQRGEALAKGVDTQTANLLGVTAAVTTGVSMAAPMSLGARTALDVGRTAAVGAGVNVATGVVQRGLNHDILAAAGYKDMASQYEALDQGAMLADGALGALFGTGAAAIELRSNSRARAIGDAALTLQQSKHAAVDSAPGVPADPAAAGAHAQALDGSIENLLHDRPVEVPPEMVGPPFQPREEPAKAAALEEAKAQITEEATIHAPAEAAPRETPHVEGEVHPDIEASDLAPEKKPVLAKMFANAAERKPAFDAAISDIAAEVGGTPKLAGLKGIGRTIAKIISDYAGDPAGMKDILRATIQVDDAASAQRAIAALQQKFTVLEKGQRNLLDPAVATVDGYRDAKFNVLIDGHVAEVQVNLPEMLAAKKQVHAQYAAREAIVRKALDENRKLTKKDQAEIDRLNADMRAVYEPAWASALSKSKNAALETGAPLRRAEEGSNLRGGDESQAAHTGTPGESQLPSETGMPSTSKNSQRGENSGDASESLDIGKTSDQGIPENTPKVNAETRSAAVKQALESRSGKVAAPEIAAARAAADNRPEMMVPTGKVDEAGKPQTITASAMADYVAESFARADADAKAYQAAITCMLSNPS